MVQKAKQDVPNVGMPFVIDGAANHLPGRWIRLRSSPGRWSLL